MNFSCLTVNTMSYVCIYLSILFSGFSLTVFGNDDQIKHYNGYSVLRLIPITDQQIVYLKNLSDYSHNEEIKFWKIPTRIRESVDIMVSPQIKYMLKKQLENENFNNITTIIDDVENLIKEELIATTRKQTTDNLNLWQEYNRFAKINSFLDSIAFVNPSIASTEIIGRSSEGREIKLIKLSSNKRKRDKPIVFIDSGFHAREWITPAVTTYFIQQLVDGYKQNNNEIVRLLDAFEWNILAVANPDGYEYSHTRDRMWRKTRSRRSGRCIGVDPNRNFGYKWAVIGASHDSCADTYAGPQPLSEPEMKAIADYILRNKQRVKIYLNIHSYSQVWLYPWGWTSSVTNDNNALREKATIAVNALSKHYNTQYRVGTSANVLYPAAGGSDDWAYGVAGVRYSYTVELRDTGRYGFMLPNSEIIPTAIETSSAFKALANSVASELKLWK